MIIAAISDMHGQLDFSIKEGTDLLLIAGDLAPAYHDPFLSLDMQVEWFRDKFSPWLSQQPVKECVAVAGNHDWLFEKHRFRLPFISDHFHYLMDEEIEVLGLRVYGTPWQPPFNNWAFNASDERLKVYWEKIPKNLDILLCHCPPWKIMDKVVHPNFQKHIGSKILYNKIKEVAPKYVVFGHNHGEYGVVSKNGIEFINCSLLDESYKMVNGPVYVDA